MNLQATAEAPPGFYESTNLRQKVRATGLDPNYWYAVEEVRNMKPGSVTEIVFWKQSIALYRTKEGDFNALENRCAHRQIKLSLGDVDGCTLVCPYHGWSYDNAGRRADNRKEGDNPEKIRPSITSYPVKVRYGLVWLFPGDPERAAEQEIPDIPELEGKDRWACASLHFTWSAHHSMVIDNVSDFSHAYLHRKY